MLKKIYHLSDEGSRQLVKAGLVCAFIILPAYSRSYCWPWSQMKCWNATLVQYKGASRFGGIGELLSFCYS